MKYAILCLSLILCTLTWITSANSQPGGVSSSQQSWSSPTTVIAVGAMLVSMLSLSFAILQFYLNRRDQQTSKMREQLLNSLQWFGEGIQERSIGIAIIEAHWDDVPDLKKIWIAVLLSQAIHILTRSKQQASETQLDNLNRIVKLLWNANLSQDQRATFCDVLSSANYIDSSGQKHKRNDEGLLVEEQKINNWKNHFKC